MAWLILFISGLLEVVWASAMKYSDGFTKPVPTIITLVVAAFGFWLLGFAMRTLPLGTAYTVWVGIGAVGAFAVGVIWLNEPLSLGRSVSAALILIGVIGLSLTERG